MTEHYIHPREEWLDPKMPWEGFPGTNGQPYKCPPFRGWSAIKDLVIHYPGADWASMDFNRDGKIDLNDDITQIRSQHYFYANSRKYSLGYCYLIGQTGEIWESRGTRNTNAANLGDGDHGTIGWNNYSISIQLIVDEQNPATAAQVASVNWLLDELTRQKGSALNLRWHGWGQYTTCAGAGIINQIKTGVIGFGKSTTPQPPVPPTPPTPPVPVPGTAADTYPPGSEKTMTPIDYGIAGTDWWWTELAITPKGLQWSAPYSSGGNAQNDKIRQIFIAIPFPRAPRLQNDADVVNLMTAIGTFGPVPSTFTQNAGLTQAWNANLNKGR